MKLARDSVSPAAQTGAGEESDATSAASNSSRGDINAEIGVGAGAGPGQGLLSKSSSFRGMISQLTTRSSIASSGAQRRPSGTLDLRQPPQDFNTGELSRFDSVASWLASMDLACYEEAFSHNDYKFEMVRQASEW